MACGIPVMPRYLPKPPKLPCDTRFVTRVAVGRQIQRLRNPSEACYKIRDCREGVDRVQEEQPPLGTIKTDAVILARVRSCRVLCSVLGVGYGTKRTCNETDENGLHS